MGASYPTPAPNCPSTSATSVPNTLSVSHLPSTLPATLTPFPYLAPHLAFPASWRRPAPMSGDSPGPSRSL